jgi:hypothetical protein
MRDRKLACQLGTTPKDSQNGDNAWWRQLHLLTVQLLESSSVLVDASDGCFPSDEHRHMFVWIIDNFVGYLPSYVRQFAEIDIREKTWRPLKVDCTTSQRLPILVGS